MILKLPLFDTSSAPVAMSGDRGGVLGEIGVTPVVNADRVYVSSCLLYHGQGGER